jgi:hypothetical protein
MATSGPELIHPKERSAQGSLADITARSCHVRFTSDSRHSSVQLRCPKSAISGYRGSVHFCSAGRFFARNCWGDHSVVIVGPSGFSPTMSVAKSTGSKRGFNARK